MHAWVSRVALGVIAVGFAIVAIAVVVACNRPASEPRLARATVVQEALLSPRAEGLTTESRRELASLRAAIAPYREVGSATAAGYMQITGCMSDPVEGGMGVLYGMTSRFDGRPQPNAPEILVYAPDERGRLRLVAAEYAVPFDAWTPASPPELFGQQFHRDSSLGLWVLQAWIWKANPSGIFAAYNPLVACENA